MEKILIIDDVLDLLETLSLALEQEGYEVRTAETGGEAMACIRTDTPDLILLDVMLEDISGIDLAARLKGNPETAHIPIIMLTARDTEADIIVGLKMGADDYITKPFSTAVLLARIETILRRAKLTSGGMREILSAGDVKVHLNKRSVRAGGKEIDLTEGEYNILVALMEAGGAVLSREDLKECLGERAKGEKERIVDVHIAAARKKLGEHKDIIKTVHGRGYRIVF
ncbi:Transcriptional regulatory protein CseB [Anaerohalosphaera lusitana]|uniref:Transcriptional regulatory protein CseB n=1 Tax=Anaerohalosphaera lusitana TaxID=1936003 RepID=A0A1U9NLA5_9BACT|nr:response regulator transcription factor [Anaerohalosphaera lusitana]AQT68689.1 Transcriptional regulatory protein CseB [Anaerohalosphaera lusitana]